MHCNNVCFVDIFQRALLSSNWMLSKHTNLHGARATANHLRNGGRFGDQGSELIEEMVKDTKLYDLLDINESASEVIRSL